MSKSKQKTQKQTVQECLVVAFDNKTQKFICEFKLNPDQLQVVGSLLKIDDIERVKKRLFLIEDRTIINKVCKMIFDVDADFSIADCEWYLIDVETVVERDITNRFYDAMNYSK